MDTGCSNISFINQKEFMREFTKKAAELRIPLSGTLELTHRCNLKCIHCYSSVASLPPQNHYELDTCRFLSIIDEIADSGCFELLITGGEPLLRPDFVEIYRYAKIKGLIVTVFTNGTLITGEILDILKEYPPYLVEISLYGATSATYESVTGVSGSFARCIDGIEKLISQGSRVKLKTMLMTLNCHELNAMEEMARHYNLSFRLDAALFPRFDGDRTPLSLRIPPGQAVEQEFSDAERLQSWKEFYGRGSGAPDSDQLYVCGAGTTGFHIDPYGILRPCLMVRNIALDLSVGSFLESWDTITKEIGSRKISSSYACSSCDRYALCGACPAFFELENGAENIHSEYLCAMGNERQKKLKICMESQEEKHEKG